MSASSRRRHRRATLAVSAGFLAAGAVAVAAWMANPWPASLVIRALFERGARDTAAEMKPFAPAEGIDSKLNVSYGDAGGDTTLNVFYPAGTTNPLPTVVWIHGGAWISGNKEDVDHYLRMLAQHGFTAVSVNYSIAPETTYPTAVAQLNEALAFLEHHAQSLNVDASRIIIAGDSAGAQLTSQLANIITNPAFAAQMDIVPALLPSQLRGVILNCGIYDVSDIPSAPGIDGWGFRIALWGYLGERHRGHSEEGRQLSSIEFVTPHFPPTWISGGNNDALTKHQSEPFAAKLRGLGVAVTALFYDDDHRPPLPHEYQFHLKLPDAHVAFESTVAFAKEVTA